MKALSEVGDYKTIDATGMQVLITRTKSGQVEVFVNACTHRGARLVEEGRGRTPRFTCPYHAWTFSPDGDLVAIYAEDEFGELDKSQYGLTELSCLERAGLIWAILNPHSSLEIEQFLCGYDDMLAQFGFDYWHLQATQPITISGGPIRIWAGPARTSNSMNIYPRRMALAAVARWRMDHLSAHLHCQLSGRRPLGHDLAAFSRGNAGYVEYDPVLSDGEGAAHG